MRSVLLMSTLVLATALEKCSCEIFCQQWLLHHYHHYHYHHYYYLLLCVAGLKMSLQMTFMRIR